MNICREERRYWKRRVLFSTVFTVSLHSIMFRSLRTIQTIWNYAKPQKTFPELLPISIQSFSSKSKKGIDFSLVPKLSDDDLEEWLVRGSGPGGQAVNKTSNCVMLRHKPTGIVVKCHITRITEQNRKLAREMLIARLDQKINGDMSVENQRKTLEAKKSVNDNRKRRKLQEMKQKWKERETAHLNGAIDSDAKQ